MTRWWPLIPLLLAVLLTAVSDASARGRCDQHLRGAELRTSKVAVFVRGDRADEEAEHRYYACRRPSGKAVFVGTALPHDGVYGSDSSIRRLRAAGPYVSVLITEGNASSTACDKYSGDSCPSPRRFFRVVDTRARSRTDVPVDGIVERDALSPGGAIAWLDRNAVLYASDLEAPPRELDRGAISALRFAGLTLNWMRDGAPHAATISGGA